MQHNLAYNMCTTTSNHRCLLDILGISAHLSICLFVGYGHCTCPVDWTRAMTLMNFQSRPEMGKVLVINALDLITSRSTSANNSIKFNELPPTIQSGIKLDQ